MGLLQAGLLSFFRAHFLGNLNSPLLRRQGRDFSWTNEIFHLLSRFIKSKNLSVLVKRLMASHHPAQGF